MAQSKKFLEQLKLLIEHLYVICGKGGDDFYSTQGGCSLELKPGVKPIPKLSTVKLPIVRATCHLRASKISVVEVPKSSERNFRKK
jgi:hypothetical protein